MLPVQGPAYPLSVCWCSCGCRCSLRVALRRPRQPWQRWRRRSWCPLPGCSVSVANLPLLPARPARTLPRLSASPSFWAVRALAASPWLGGGATTGLLFPALRPTSPAHGGRSKPPDNTGNKLPQPLQKRKAPWKPRADRLQPLPVPFRRGVAAGSRGVGLPGGRAGRHGQQCRPTASVAYPRVRSASCKIHLPSARQPVYRAKLNAAASGRIYSSSKRRTNGKRAAATFFCSSVRRSLSVLAELREPSALAVGFRGKLAEQPYLGHSPIARNRFL